jgi:hypothetical protein
MTVDSERVEKLRERVRAADGKWNPHLDWLVAEAMGQVPEHRVMEVGWDYVWYRRPDEWCLWKATDSEGRQTDLWQPERVTSSIDAAVALVERVLPGWCWRTGTCSVSDDAWISPDRQGPAAHLLADRLFDEGFDVDRRPALGQVGCCLALIEATLSALIALAQAQAGPTATGEG